MPQLGLNLPPPAPLSLLALVINLAIGLGLALLLRWHFLRYGTTLSNRAEFAQVFPFIVLTTTLIITVVKSSLALSLGLVGALSIVRFRTPIKEPEELAYLFLAIAMGLGLGADQRPVTIVAGVAILGVIALLRSSQTDREQKNLYLSLQWSAAEPGEESVGAINRVLARHVTTGDLRRLDRRDGTCEATYFIDVTDSEAISRLVGELEQSFPGIAVTFIDQTHLPSV